MELVIFALNGILVYFISDWLVRRIEQKRGGVLKQRQVVFFVIFLALALTSFAFLRILFVGP
jgi:hypothetical protein